MFMDDLNFIPKKKNKIWVFSVIIPYLIFH